MTTITVTTAEELATAIANATGGETILLAPGDYGTLALRGNAQPHLAFDETLTIRSADPDNPARFTKLDMREAANITLDGLYFDYVYAEGDANHYRPFAVWSSDGITISNSIFDGDRVQSVLGVNDTFGHAIGLSVRGSDDVVIDGNEFFHFNRAASFNTSTNVQVLRNDVHDIRLDGFNFSQMQGVVVAENHIHDFAGLESGNDHADMIQFWTRNTDAPSTDIVIRDNILDIGNGTPTHSIFMRNEMADTGLAGEEIFYRDVEITGNTIVNGHLHGIAIGETIGLQITQNTVVRSDGGFPDGRDSAVELPRIAVNAAARDVTITGNVTGAIQTSDTTEPWGIANNVIVQDQDPQAPGYYGAVFIASSLSNGQGAPGLIAKAGGEIDLANAGAARLQPETAEPTAHFNVTRDADAPQLYHFAAVQPPQTVLDGAFYTWTFSDGRSATGPEVTRYFPEGGEITATLTVALPGADTAVQSAQLELPGQTVLTLDPLDGLIAFEAGQPIYLEPAGPEASDGIVMAGTGVSEEVAREHVWDILGAEAFEIDLSVSALLDTASGDMFRLHSSILTQVDRDGDVVVRAWSETGEKLRLTSSGIDVADLGAHDISIRYEDDTLALWLDGILQAEKTMLDPLANVGRHDLVFGNPWGRKSFESVIDSFEITLGEEADALWDADTSIVGLPLSADFGL